MQFSGKNVLVTGAASGIGKEIALTLAGYGLKVWVNYRSRPEQADAIKAEIEANGGVAAVIGFDVADEEAFIEGSHLPNNETFLSFDASYKSS